MKWTVFDLEFNQLLPQLGEPWPEDLHVICGSIFSTGDQWPNVWHEYQGHYMSECTLASFIDVLLELYKSGHRIATWGGSATDWRMLAKDCPSRIDTIRLLALDSVDVPMCSCVAIGTMMGLNAACMGLGFTIKEPGASEAIPEMWRDVSKRSKVLQHVSNDAHATMKVILNVEETGSLPWLTAKNQIKYWREVSLINTRDCLAKELPEVPWTIGPSQNAKLMARWLLFL